MSDESCWVNHPETPGCFCDRPADHDGDHICNGCGAHWAHVRAGAA